MLIPVGHHSPALTKGCTYTLCLTEKINLKDRKNKSEGQKNKMGHLGHVI